MPGKQHWRIGGSMDRRIDGSAGRRIRRSHDRSILRSAALLLCAVCLATPATAQYTDARLVPKGVLRIGFEPQYSSYRERFDAAGLTEPLGTDFTDSAAGVRLFPTLATPQSALGSIIGDPSYAMNLGAFRTTLDADHRQFPLTLQFGLLGRLTLTARVPLVTTRSQVDFVVDSTVGDVGWNQLATQSGNSAAALQDIQTLFAELDAAAAAVDARIAAGDYGCPSSPECDDAREAVDDARQLKLDLAALAGVDGSGTPAGILTPFAPLTGSSAGSALLAAIQDVTARLTALGAPAVTAIYPLPAAAIGAGGANEMLADSAYGYAASPLAFTKYSMKLGDIEVGLRLGLVQSRSFRAVLATTVRLPTGKLDDPDNYLDIGTGDKQPDVEFGFEGAWEPGSFLGLAGSASYNLQLSHNLVRRVSSHVRPIAPLTTRATVARKLGDELRAALHPSLRLSPAFTAYGTVAYYRRASNTYDLVGTPPSGEALDASELAFETSMTSWSFGGGIHYYHMGRSGQNLPIEAGIDYRAAFQGEGGQTPKYGGVTFYLRLHWRLFGRGEEQPIEAAPTEPPPAEPSTEPS
jgi:hypothetical protein